MIELNPKHEKLYYKGEVGGLKILAITAIGPHIRFTRYEVLFLGCGHIKELSHYTIRGYVKEDLAKRKCQKCIARTCMKNLRAGDYKDLKRKAPSEHEDAHALLNLAFARTK